MSKYFLTDGVTVRRMNGTVVGKFIMVNGSKRFTLHEDYDVGLDSSDLLDLGRLVGRLGL